MSMVKNPGPLLLGELGVALPLVLRRGVRADCKASYITLREGARGSAVCTLDVVARNARPALNVLDPDLREKGHLHPKESCLKTTGV